MNKSALIIISLIFLLILIMEFIPSNAPENVYIRVLKSDQITPEENANCKADIMVGNDITEDKPLEKVENMAITCVDNCDKNYNKGFYKLETGLNNYQGKFEIRIVCMSSIGISYTILNNTYIPCEPINNGRGIKC